MLNKSAINTQSQDEYRLLYVNCGYNLLCYAEGSRAKHIYNVGSMV